MGRSRSAELFARCRANDASITGVIERFLESVCLDGYFGQERVERHDSHRPDEPRHESLDEHESFARRDLVAVMHEVPDCGIVYPVVEGTPPSIDRTL